MSIPDEVRAIRKAARLVWSRREVADALARMAHEIESRVADRDPVVIAVLQGGAFTAVNLCAHFEFPYEYDYVHATRYGASLSGGELTWLRKPDDVLAGRTVLLIDDVLDRGVTLNEICREVERSGPAELLVAVLVRKRLASAQLGPEPDFIGLSSDDSYLFGCGMDYKGYWRGLPEIFAVTDS